MIITLMLILGILVGIGAHKIGISAYGIWWNIGLGIAGSILGNALLAMAYMLNFIGSLHWYNVIIGSAGAFVLIHWAKFYTNSEPLDLFPTQSLLDLKRTASWEQKKI